MILVGILDTAGVDISFLNNSDITENEKKRLLGIKNEFKRKESFATRLLLKKICEDFFGKAFGEIEYTQKGKAYFVDGKLEFSISHDKSLVAVAVTDGGSPIGIDLQSSAIAPEMRERLKKRFLRDIDTSDFEEDFDFKLLKFESAGEEIRETKNETLFENAKCDEFLEKWTRMEACMKLFGCGFEGLPNINNCLQKTKIKTLFLQHGVRCYAISIAVEK